MNLPVQFYNDGVALHTQIAGLLPVCFDHKGENVMECLF